MRHYFLVDYENVKEKGLDGFFALSRKDRVYVFYSVNQQKISMDFVSVLKTKRNLPYIEYVFVKAGKQSLDMQLSSFLGSLIAENGIRRCDYTIISADRDFLPVVDFWNRRNGSSCVHEFSSIEKYLKKDDTPDEVKTIREKTPVAGRTPSSARAHYEKPSRSGEEKKTERRYEDHRRERSETEKIRTDSRRKEERPAEAAVSSEAPVLTSLSAEAAPEAVIVKKETEKTRTQKTRRSRAEKPAQESVKEPAKEEAIPEVSVGEPSSAAVSEEPVTSPEPAAEAEEEKPETEPAPEKTEESVPEEPAAEETPAAEEGQDPGENRSSQKTSAPKKKTSSRSGEKAQKPGAAKEESNAQAPSPVNSKTLLNNRLQSALAKAQVDQKVAIEITHLVLSHMDEKNFKQIVYLEMIKKYRQAEGLSYYRIIQPVMQDAI